MRGTPVWLASVSRYNPLTGGRLATGSWTHEQLAEGTDMLRRLLGPAGDPTRERLFRMNITLCLHRAATDAEIETAMRNAPGAESIDLAGGPIEVLWESEPGSLSTKPCHNPRREYIDARDRQIWLPHDCGSCEPCRARAAIMRSRSPVGKGDDVVGSR